jgi:hypothetical protein
LDAHDRRRRNSSAHRTMKTPLPAASSMACLAWPSRWLFSKLRWGGRKGVRWVYGSTRDPPVRHEDVAAVHAAHDRSRAALRVDESAEGVQYAGRKARKGSKDRGVRMRGGAEMVRG